MEKFHEKPISRYEFLKQVKLYFKNKDFKSILLLLYVSFTTIVWKICSVHKQQKMYAEKNKNVLTL